jgi:hypothetical protein
MKVCVSVLRGTFLVVVILVPLAACPAGGDLPTGGGGSSGTGMVSCGGSSGTSTLATWTNVRDVVDNTCAGADCHETREPLMIGSTGPLSDTALYSKLTTYVTTMCGGRMLVKPCAPADSAFHRAQAGMCEGAAGTPLPYMPFGCDPMYDNCTPADKLEGIRQWIANGAPRP